MKLLVYLCIIIVIISTDGAPRIQLDAVQTDASVNPSDVPVCGEDGADAPSEGTCDTGHTQPASAGWPTVPNGHTQPADAGSKGHMTRAQRRAECDSDCQLTYLTKYGYIDELSQEGPDMLATSPMRTSPERTKTVSEGFLKLQREAGIEETGYLDRETFRLLQTPRCGVTYGTRQKRFVILKGWNTAKNGLNETVVSWHLDLSNFRHINTSLTSHTIRTIVATSLTRWAKTALIHFKEVTDEKEANIIIKFLGGDHDDGHSFDGPGQVLAHAFYPNTRLGGNVHFDLGEEWTLWDEKRGSSLFNVAMHELGHAIGIGHSSQQNSVMYAWYRPSITELSNDDTAAVNQLYGVKPQYRFGPIGPAISTTTARNSQPTYHPVRPKGWYKKYELAKIRKLFIRDSKVFIYPKLGSFLHTLSI